MGTCIKILYLYNARGCISWGIDLAKEFKAIPNLWGSKL